MSWAAGAGATTANFLLEKQSQKGGKKKKKNSAVITVHISTGSLCRDQRFIIITRIFRSRGVGDFFFFLNQD
jgi:hypothetical protein